MEFLFAAFVIALIFAVFAPKGDEYEENDVCNGDCASCDECEVWRWEDWK